MSPHLSSLFAVVILGLGPAQQNASAPSLDRPCSFATASEVSTLLGVTVTAGIDEHFRCKYIVGKGWLETKLLDSSLRMTKDIYDYVKGRGKPVPGLGDQAYVLGATLVARVGDVIVDVDGSNLQPAPDTAKLTSVAARIVQRIP